MSKLNLRKLHRAVAPIIMLPLFVTIITGMTYRLGKSWLGLSKDQVHFLMVIHEGEYLGKQLEPVYVLLNGLGVLFMLVTGVGMLFSTLSKAISKSQVGKKTTTNQ